MKKKLFIIGIIAALSLSAAGCKSDDVSTTDASTQIESQEETEISSETEESTEDTRPYEELSLEEKLERLWRLDLPEAAENQSTHDDTVNNIISYFPSEFVLQESKDDGQTIIFANELDDAYITFTVKDNSNEYTLEEFSDVLGNEYPESNIKMTGQYGFVLTGHDKDGKIIKIKAVCKNDKTATLMIAYPEDKAEKYELKENDITLMFSGLDANGDEIKYTVK